MFNDKYLARGTRENRRCKGQVYMPGQIMLAVFVNGQPVGLFDDCLTPDREGRRQ